MQRLLRRAPLTILNLGHFGPEGLIRPAPEGSRHGPGVERSEKPLRMEIGLLLANVGSRRGEESVLCNPGILEYDQRRLGKARPCLEGSPARAEAHPLLTGP